MSNYKSNCSNCSAPTEANADNELTIQEVFSSIAIIVGRLGLLFNNKGDSPELWQTQMMDFAGRDLNNGQNTSRVEPVLHMRSGIGFDIFIIINMICYYHQDV